MPSTCPLFLLITSLGSQGFIGEFREQFEALARVLKSPQKDVPQAGLSTHSGSGVIWDSGCGPGPSRPVELTVINTRTFLSWSLRVWHESLTCPRRLRFSSTSSSALVIFSGSPSRYSMRHVVHLAYEPQRCRISTPASSSIAKTNLLFSGTSKVPTPSTSSLGIYPSFGDGTCVSVVARSLRFQREYGGPSSMISPGKQI